MSNNPYTIKKNIYWESVSQSPYFTVITPVFNRKHTIKRTLDSVKNQTFKDFEYIIIDDGSTDDPFDIICSFMDSADFPVMLVAKPNGGVHTARNLGIKLARGMYSFFLDSDDEMTKNALQVAKLEWEKIPADERQGYYQIKGRCMDQYGSMVGRPFPGNINDIEWSRRPRVAQSVNGEQIGIRNMSIMKAFPWPEPEGVTFVKENVLWHLLDKKYKSRYFNTIIRVYHTEGEDHLSNINKKVKKTYLPQDFRNHLWESAYYLDNRNIYIDSVFDYIKEIIRYSVSYIVLKKNNDVFCKRYLLKRKTDKVIHMMVLIPVRIATEYFIYKKRFILHKIL